MKIHQCLTKYYSSICLLAKNENDYINEWLEWHLNKLKFDHVYIYDNESSIPIEMSIDDKYKNKITFLTWDRRDYKFIMQNECYKHFLNNFSTENTWTAFIDADEFIRLVDCDEDNINDFLLNYEDANALYIEWTMYNANGQYMKTEGLVRDRFKNTIYYPHDAYSGKCIIKPSEYNYMGPHYPFKCKTISKMVDSNKKLMKITNNNINVPKDKIVVDHYFTKSYEEWCEKLGRGSCNTLKRKLDEFFKLNPDMNPKEVK